MRLTTWVRALLQRRRAHRELEDELEFHLQMAIEANVARGMTPASARQAALAAFGGIVQARELVRDVRTMTIESVWQDVRHAVRTLAAHRGFTLAAAGMLALGIGIATAMFTIVDALVLRPMPFRDPQQLAHVWMGTDRGGRSLVDPAVVRAWRESPAFARAESAMPETALLETGQTVVTRGMATVTPGVFDLLGGVRPVQGRLFVADEGRAGQNDRLLVSETVWRTLYGAETGFVGRSLTVNGERLTVIGILPAEFRFPSADTVLWKPTNLASRPRELARAYVRFTPGMPREEALRLATDAARAADAANASLRPRVYTLAGMEDEYSRRAVPMLAGGVGLVFLVLCANVCGLLLARLTARRREFSMRAALGASRGRLIRQAVVESCVLGTAGALLGAGLAWALVSVARALLPEPMLLQTLNPLDIDARALAVTSVAGVLATLASGLVPAWLGTRVDAGDSLRVVDRSGTEARGARALTRGLLVAEVALACTLLVGATLLTRSFVNLARADRGLVTSGVTTLWLSLDAAVSKDPVTKLAITRSLEAELRQLPGIRQLAWSYGLPPGGGMTSYGDWISDAPGLRSLNLELDRYVVSPEFFGLYGIPIIRGRTFAPHDTFNDVIVSDRLARTLWPGTDPVGRTFRFIDQSFQVIGVAREIHLPAIDSRLDRPEFYHPYTAASATPMVSLRCDPACPEAAVIRHRLASAYPTVRVQNAKLADRDYAEQLERPRASAALAATFAAIAVLAAAGGLFSVLSYTVSRRRREFGIRTALGASRRQIRRAVLRDAVVISGLGLVLGAIFAAWLARALASLEYGITPGDPLTWSMVFVLLTLTTLAAAWLPASTAARLDPLVLLREE
jgi:putative ABC transport system permease protein